MNRKRDLNELSLLYEGQSSALAQGLVDNEETQNPLEDYEGEESMVGKVVRFTNKPSLDQIRAGVGIETYEGKVIQDLGNSVLMDLGVGLAEIPKSDLDLGEDNEEGTMETTADDQGPNQITADGPASAMGGEEQLSGDVSPITQSSKNPDTGDETFDAPDEDAEFNMDPYYNREEDLRSRGIDPDAEDPDADEKGKEERRHKDEDAEFMNHLLMRRARANQREDIETGNKGKEQSIKDAKRFTRKAAKNINRLKTGDATQGRSKLPTLKEVPKKDRPKFNPDDIPTEDEEMSLEDAIKVINKHLKAKLHGDKSHANKEVRDAKLAYVRGILKKRDETKKESYNSHGDRDMSLLAEKYLNIKHDE